MTLSWYCQKMKGLFGIVAVILMMQRYAYSAKTITKKKPDGLRTKTINIIKPSLADIAMLNSRKSSQNSHEYHKIKQGGSITASGTRRRLDVSGSPRGVVVKVNGQQVLSQGKNELDHLPAKPLSREQNDVGKTSHNRNHIQLNINVNKQNCKETEHPEIIAMAPTQQVPNMPSSVIIPQVLSPTSIEQLGNMARAPAVINLGASTGILPLIGNQGNVVTPGTSSIGMMGYPGNGQTTLTNGNAISPGAIGYPSNGQTTSPTIGAQLPLFGNQARAPQAMGYPNVGGTGLQSNSQNTLQANPTQESLVGNQGNVLLPVGSSAAGTSCCPQQQQCSAGSCYQCGSVNQCQTCGGGVGCHTNPFGTSMFCPHDVDEFLYDTLECCKSFPCQSGAVPITKSPTLPNTPGTPIPNNPTQPSGGISPQTANPVQNPYPGSLPQSGVGNVQGATNIQNPSINPLPQAGAGNVQVAPNIQNPNPGTLPQPGAGNVQSAPINQNPNNSPLPQAGGGNAQGVPTIQRPNISPLPQLGGVGNVQGAPTIQNPISPLPQAGGGNAQGAPNIQNPNISPVPQPCIGNGQGTATIQNININPLPQPEGVGNVQGAPTIQNPISPLPQAGGGAPNIQNPNISPVSQTGAVGNVQGTPPVQGTNIPNGAQGFSSIPNAQTSVSSVNGQPLQGNQNQIPSLQTTAPQLPNAPGNAPCPAPVAGNTNTADQTAINNLSNEFANAFAQALKAEQQKQGQQFDKSGKKTRGKNHRRGKHHKYKFYGGDDEDDSTNAYNGEDILDGQGEFVIHEKKQPKIHLIKSENKDISYEKFSGDGEMRKTRFGLHKKKKKMEKIHNVRRQKNSFVLNKLRKYNGQRHQLNYTRQPKKNVRNKTQRKTHSLMTKTKQAVANFRKQKKLKGFMKKRVKSKTKQKHHYTSRFEMSNKHHKKLKKPYKQTNKYIRKENKRKTKTNRGYRTYHSPNNVKVPETMAEVSASGSGFFDKYENYFEFLLPNEEDVQ